MSPRVLAASLAVLLVPLVGGCGWGAGSDSDEVRDAVAHYSDRDRIDVDMRGPDHAGATFETAHHALSDARFALVRTPEGWRIERLTR